MTSYRYIYLVFTKTGTWLSRLIQTFSDTKYTHASISFDESFERMYSFGRINPDNPFSGGFVEENLNGGVYKKFTRCECIIYRVRITEEQYHYLQYKIGKFVQERDRLRYNFLGLFGVAVNLPIKRENHYFCSQFVSELLIDSNIFESEKTPELIKPNDLFMIKDKELFWQGLVNDYYSFFAGCEKA